MIYCTEISVTGDKWNLVALASIISQKFINTQHLAIKLVRQIPKFW